MQYFSKGFRAMLPVTAGIIPFGAVMGSVSANFNLSLLETIFMNFFVFAGASQLVAIDLLSKNVEVFIVILTGIIINLRFVLYSAAMAPTIKNVSLLKKLLTAYLLTDQNYSVMYAEVENLKDVQKKLSFYFGASLCMLITWHSSVILGYFVGDFAPKALNLDFAVPASFVALLIPTLKNNKYIMVAACSAFCSIIFNSIPFNLGLMLSAMIAIFLALYFIKRDVINE